MQEDPRFCTDRIGISIIVYRDVLYSSQDHFNEILIGTIVTLLYEDVKWAIAPQSAFYKRPIFFTLRNSQQKRFVIASKSFLKFLRIRNRKGHGHDISPLGFFKEHHFSTIREVMHHLLIPRAICQ
jgi:hypothetical protein